MTKEEFKTRWESSLNGDGITFEDVADCAIAWGLTTKPKTKLIADVLYTVLKAAQVNDAEEYAPSAT